MISQSQLTLPEEAEALLAQWRMARRTQAIPTARFIDPLSLRRWVGDISVIHVHEGEKRFFVSLHGSGVAGHLGRDFHRQYLEDAVPPEALHRTLEPYDLSLRLTEPVYSVQRRALSNGVSKSLEKMILPCSLERPGVAARFLVWVAPIETSSARSTSVYEPFEREEIHWPSISDPGVTADLFLLSEAPMLQQSA